MKKIISIVILIMIVSAFCIFVPNTNVKAENETYTLQLKEVNNKDIELYILLPKEYILYAIEKDGLNIEYDRAYTLVNNEIPSIKVESGKVSQEVYQENDVEYVQILLNKNEEGYYKFDILSDYGKIDMKYRCISDKGDFIANIENFKIKGNLCEIEYDSENNSIKQPDENILSVNPMAVVVVGLILGVIIYGSKGGN